MLLFFFHSEHNLGDFPAGSVVKNPPANAETQLDPWFRKIPTYRATTKPLHHNY